jgi:hypothetical protein
MEDWGKKWHALTVVTSVTHNRIVGKRDGERKPKKDERMISNLSIRYLRNWKDRELAIEATWIAKGHSECTLRA